MQKWTMAATLAVATMFSGSVFAADMIVPEPEYPTYPELPEVDYGLGGSFYLRGSLGGNALWARNVSMCPCADYQVTDFGWGYSYGVGAGYEFGDGWRADITLDNVHNSGLTANGYKATLRSTVALANVYYDFDLEGLGHSVEGGWKAYVGAGVGKAWSWASATDGTTTFVEGAGNRSWAGAGMVGVSYDMGNLVADVGYRALWMKGFSTSGGTDFWAQDAIAHEVRASLRYRFH